MEQVNDIPNLKSWQEEQENARCVIAIASELNDKGERTLSVDVAGRRDNMIETLVGVFLEDIRLRALCEFSMRIVKAMDTAAKVAEMTEDKQKEEDAQ